MLKYFYLRVSQIILIISLTFPLALIFSFNLSASGMLDTGMFWIVLGGSAAILWGGLAIYVRDIDRKRHLPEVMMTYVKYRYSCVSMRENEYAEIIWQILQNDSLFIKQARMIWRAVRIVLVKAFIWTPSVLLLAVSVVFWFSPATMLKWGTGIYTGSAECLAYSAGNILFSIYILTGGSLALLEMSRKQVDDIVCFNPVYKQRVHEFAQEHQKTNVAESVDSTSRQEAEK